MNKLSYAYIHTPTHIYVYYSLQSDFFSHTTHLYAYSHKRAYSHTRIYLYTHTYTANIHPTHFSHKTHLQMCCSVLRVTLYCVERLVGCSVLQCVAVCYSVLQWHKSFYTIQCNTQHTATHIQRKEPSPTRNHFYIRTHAYLIFTLQISPLFTQDTSIYILRRDIPTGWRRPIGCRKSQVIFCKRATNYRALLLKMTNKDKASYDSTPSYKTTLTALSQSNPQHFCRLIDV